MLLTRVLEPEVMDTEEDAEEYSAIDHRVVNDLFVQSLLKQIETRGGNILDLGSGPADIPLALCRELSTARVVAVEMGSRMIALAKQRIEKAGLADRLILIQGDAKQTGLPSQTFDVIISNSLIHHIPEPLTVFKEISRLLRKGGRVFLKDLRRPDSIQELEALVTLHAANDTPYQRELFRNSLHAALRPEEVEAFAKAAGLDPFKLSFTSDRHWELVK